MEKRDDVESLRSGELLRLLSVEKQILKFELLYINKLLTFRYTACIMRMDDETEVIAVGKNRTPKVRKSKESRRIYPPHGKGAC